jgi:hypothetical protein
MICLGIDDQLRFVTINGAGKAAPSPLTFLAVPPAFGEDSAAYGAIDGKPSFGCDL